ncbi:MAG: NADH-quinone oxidoreductase subunit J [Candidatus Bipolaricaulia bacterium]
MNRDRMTKTIGIGLVAVLLSLMILSLTSVEPWDRSPEGTERISGIGETIFERYVFPFEILSVLLLATLIGAIFLARKEE